MPKVLRGDRSHLDGAAQVWAEATAARDGDAEVAPLAFSRPIIASVLDREGAVLVLAIDEGNQVVAFAAAAPVPDGTSSPATTAEVEYVGVSPGQWGQGLARSLLRLLRAELAV